MITKAIVEEVGRDGYHLRVRIPIFHKIENAPGSTPFKELPMALINYSPGCKPNYSPGDIVYVGFENDQYSEPVIIGSLLNDSYENMNGSILTDSINDVSIDDILTNNVYEQNIEIDLTNEEYDNLLLALEGVNIV